jgi:small-conductance mechanosensitive channel
VDNEFKSLVEAFKALHDGLFSSFNTLVLPSRINQVVLVVACLLGAWVAQRIVGPRLHGWMREREGWPKWRLRALLMIHRRLQLIFFVLFTWASAGVISMMTPFPSQRYLVTLAATIATAMLLVTLATRLIKNGLLRRVLTWGLWIYVTLYYLGLVRIFSAFLDRVAIEVGNFRLSMLTVINALVVVAALWTLARFLTQISTQKIQGNRDISPSMQVLAVKVLQIGLYGAALFIGMKAVGFDLTGLAVLSGAIGVGLGFGLQKVVSNLVSGVIILLDKSVKPGDVISLGDTFGWIEALGARYVSVVTRDGKEYLIPNEDLITGQVVNWSHSNEYVRIDLFFGTAYGDDPHLVRKVAVEAAYSVNRVLRSHNAVCHITGFGDSSVDYILRFWIRDPAEGLTNVRGAVYLALWDAFKANGISIPFPQREVTMLSGAKASEGPAGQDEANASQATRGFMGGT